MSVVHRPTDLKKSRQPPAHYLHFRHATGAFHLQILAPDCRPVSKVLTLFKVDNNFCVVGRCRCTALFVGEEYAPLHCGEEPQHYHCAGAK
jgi:hypothetical protein